MNSQSFRFETRVAFRWAAFLGAVILLTLTAGFARRSSEPGRTVRVHGRRLALGPTMGKKLALPPTSGEERGEGGRWRSARASAALDREPAPRAAGDELGRRRGGEPRGRPREPGEGRWAAAGTGTSGGRST